MHDPQLYDVKKLKKKETIEAINKNVQLLTFKVPKALKFY